MGIRSMKREDYQLTSNHMEIRQHKPGCMANVVCAVYHPDGICPGPYGQCTCEQIEEKPIEVHDGSELVSPPKENKEECGCDDGAKLVKNHIETCKYYTPVPQTPDSLEERFNSHFGIGVFSMIISRQNDTSRIYDLKTLLDFIEKEIKSAESTGYERGVKERQKAPCKQCFVIEETMICMHCGKDWNYPHMTTPK